MAWEERVGIKPELGRRSLPYACRVFYADSFAAEMNARVKLART